MTEIERDLRALVAKVAKSGAADIGLDDDLMDRLGLDSLAGLRLLAAVEKRFAVRLPDERLAEFRTLRKILEFLDGPRGGKTP